MKIQRHVRQDFQPCYIKLESLKEVKLLRAILNGDELTGHGSATIKEMRNKLISEMDTIIEAGGILP